MQNSPSQLKNCTTASRRIVRGIAFMPANISTNALPGPPALGAPGAGGCSLVLMIVQRTQLMNTAAPT